MKEIERKTSMKEEGALQKDSMTVRKKQLINLIQSSRDDYFIRSVLTYARCLDRTLKKI